RLSVVLMKLNDVAGSKEALSHALEEDLAFYPAHVLLASIALAATDTATAVQEMDLAVQLHPDEAYPYMRQADLSIAIGKPEVAKVALTKVVALEPFYAQPHFLLGQIAESAKQTEEARTHYRGFLARAAKDNRDTDIARTRLQALGTAQ